MPVALALSGAEFTLTTTAVTAAGTEIVSDPGSSSVSKKVSLTLANKTASDAFVDVVRWNGAAAFYIANTRKVPANDTLILTDIFVPNGKSLRVRASAASAIDAIVDIVTRTETA